MLSNTQNLEAFFQKRACLNEIILDSIKIYFIMLVIKISEDILIFNSEVSQHSSVHVVSPTLCRIH